MPSMTTSVTCYTDRVKKKQAQACERARAGKIEPWRGYGGRTLNFSPLDKPPSRCRRGCPAIPSLYGHSGGRWDSSAQKNRAQKAETRVDRRSTRVSAFSRAWRVSSCVCAAATLQVTKAKNQRSRNSYAGNRPRQSPAQPKPRYNAKSRLDRRSTRVFAFSWRPTKAGNQRSRNSYARFWPRQPSAAKTPV